MKVNIANLIEKTYSEGPGVRAALWVQGCSIHCPGCCNRHLWAFEDRTWIESGELAKRLLDIDGIEGITLLGGEPFDQAAGLAELAASVRNSGLSVMTFTGYVLEELRATRRDDYDALLNVSDLLVDGPYLQERATTKLPWVGSDNQRLHVLTNRYASLVGLFADEESLNQFVLETNTMEIRVGTDGQLLINGFAYTDATKDFLQALRTQGIHLERKINGFLPSQRPDSE
jgi:anaerobic ribonucleoside-triphosphate reductase activating protein